ncbi:hypothetical protein [Neobacillus sp. D3-1R]|uniref:hypothetical protein n=1 Tax=Neobacillus sp. D3-1R TaxID=3445778 RepID=UPI003FA09872
MENHSPVEEQEETVEEQKDDEVESAFSIDEEEEEILQLAEQTDRNINLYKMYYNFNGEINGSIQTGKGDQYVTGGSGGQSSDISLYEIKAEELEFIRFVYEKVPAYSEKLSTLSIHHLLILTGENGVGKFSTGIHLLLQNGVEKIFEIFPEVTLEDLIHFPFKENTGYIIDHYMTLSIQSTVEHQLKVLAQKLANLNSFFIFTHANPLHLHMASSCEIPEKRHKIFINHLNYHFHHDHELLGSYLEVANDLHFREQLNQYLIPKESDLLIEQVVKYKQNQITFDDIFSSLRSHVDRQIENWFSKRPSLENLSFFITIALFNKMPLDTVLHEKKHVEGILGPFMTTDDETVDEFYEDERAKLKGLHAYLYDELKQMEYGADTIKHISFHHDTYSKSILHYVWNSFPRIRRPLLDLLRSYGESSEPLILKSIERTIVDLAPLDFKTFKDDVIQIWATHPHPKVRYLAVETLVKLAMNEATLPRVRGLIHHWSRLNHSFLTWTALAVYGKIGPMLPDFAFEDLSFVIEKQNRSLHPIIRSTALSLYRSGHEFPVMFEKSLAFIMNLMIKMENSDFPFFLFLQFMEQKEAQYPIALHYLEEIRVRKEYLVVLFKKGMEKQSTRKSTMELIYKWLDIASYHQQWLKPTGIFILEIRQELSISYREKLYNQLKKWSLNPRKTNSAIQKIIHIIDNQ